MAPRFKQVVEEETGREIVALMSGSHQHPDPVCEAFVPGPTDLLDEVTGDRPGDVVEG
jgi:hypothetical protein